MIDQMLEEVGVPEGQQEFVDATTEAIKTEEVDPVVVRLRAHFEGLQDDREAYFRNVHGRGIDAHELYAEHVADIDRIILRVAADNFDPSELAVLKDRIKKLKEDLKINITKKEGILIIAFSGDYKREVGVRLRTDLQRKGVISPVSMQNLSRKKKISKSQMRAIAAISRAAGLASFARPGKLEVPKEVVSFALYNVDQNLAMIEDLTYLYETLKDCVGIVRKRFEAMIQQVVVEQKEQEKAKDIPDVGRSRFEELMVFVEGVEDKEVAGDFFKAYCGHLMGVSYHEGFSSVYDAIRRKDFVGAVHMLNQVKESLLSNLKEYVKGEGGVVFLHNFRGETRRDDDLRSLGFSRDEIPDGELTDECYSSIRSSVSGVVLGRHPDLQELLSGQNRMCVADLCADASGKIDRMIEVIRRVGEFEELLRVYKDRMQEEVLKKHPAAVLIGKKVIIYPVPVPEKGSDLRFKVKRLASYDSGDVADLAKYLREVAGSVTVMRDGDAVFDACFDGSEVEKVVILMGYDRDESLSGGQRSKFLDPSVGPVVEVRGGLSESQITAEIRKALG